MVRYRSRVSGPLLDRVDLHVEVPSVPFRALAGEPLGAESGVVASGVLILSALLAAWLPTRRAAGVDPAEVLREE